MRSFTAVIAGLICLLGSQPAESAGPPPGKGRGNNAANLRNTRASQALQSRGTLASSITDRVSRGQQVRAQSGTGRLGRSAAPTRSLQRSPSQSSRVSRSVRPRNQNSNRTVRSQRSNRTERAQRSNVGHRPDHAGRKLDANNERRIRDSDADPGSHGRALGRDPEFRLNLADRILAKRLADIDHLRDVALKNGNLKLMDRADELEKLAREQRERRVSRVDVGTTDPDPSTEPASPTDPVGDNPTDPLPDQPTQPLDDGFPTEPTNEPAEPLTDQPNDAPLTQPAAGFFNSNESIVISESSLPTTETTEPLFSTPLLSVPISSNAPDAGRLFGHSTANVPFPRDRAFGDRTSQQARDLRGNIVDQPTRPATFPNAGRPLVNGRTPVTDVAPFETRDSFGRRVFGAAIGEQARTFGREFGTATAAEPFPRDRAFGDRTSQRARDLRGNIFDQTGRPAGFRYVDRPFLTAPFMDTTFAPIGTQGSPRDRAFGDATADEARTLRRAFGTATADDARLNRPQTPPVR